jgi:hypothetical protein
MPLALDTPSNPTSGTKYEIIFALVSNIVKHPHYNALDVRLPLSDLEMDWASKSVPDA